MISTCNSIFEGMNPLAVKEMFRRQAEFDADSPGRSNRLDIGRSTMIKRFPVRLRITGIASFSFFRGPHLGAAAAITGCAPSISR